MLAVCNYVTSRLKLFLIVLCGIIFIYISLLWTSDILIKEHNYSAFCSIAREKCMQHFSVQKIQRTQSLNWQVAKQFLETFFLWESPSVCPPKSLISTHIWKSSIWGGQELRCLCKDHADGSKSLILWWLSQGVCRNKGRVFIWFWFSDFSFKLSLKASRKVVLLLTWKTTDLVPGEKESWGVTSNAWDVKPSSYLLEWLFP